MPWIEAHGKCSCDLCYVACGRLDGFFEYDLKPYDVAAGIIIIQEAGGRVSDFEMGE
jgi:myo-inositol-1(or 4)-monophosphatase